MATWDTLFPHIMPSVRGCDPDVATFHIRQAAIEFCRRSQCWKQEIPIAVVVDQADYLIPLPTDSVASMLVSIDVLDSDGVKTWDYDVVAPQRGRELVRDYVDGCFVYLSDDGLTLSVSPIPDGTEVSLVPYLSLKPTQESAGLPDFLAEQYADTIAAGALARLLTLPKVGWRDSGEAANQRAKFLADCGSASVIASRGRARVQTRTRAFLF